MLFLQALMFYLPHIIYEMAEGKKVDINYCYWNLYNRGGSLLDRPTQLIVQSARKSGLDFHYVSVTRRRYNSRFLFSRCIVFVCSVLFWSHFYIFDSILLSPPFVVDIFCDFVMSVASRYAGSWAVSTFLCWTGRRGSLLSATSPTTTLRPWAFTMGGVFRFYQ